MSQYNPIKSKSGSSEFYRMLNQMADIHDKKSKDYSSEDKPYGNYYFAGMLANLFAHSSEDAGFVGRLAEKIYRIANLESSNKDPQNEAIEDTEIDIAVITMLWISSRRERRNSTPTQSPGEFDQDNRCYYCGCALGGNTVDLYNRILCSKLCAENWIKSGFRLS